MQVVRQQRQEFEGKELVVDMPDPAQVVAPAPSAIRFEVRYRLLEYLGMLGGHVAFLLRREDPATKRRRTRMPLAIALLAALPALALEPGWMRVALITLGCMALASLPITARFWTLLVGTPMFYLKKRRMPVCAFRIDADGIERTTAHGRRFWPWSDFTSVRRYRPGYLLMCRDGGLPIPVRCMGAQELERFRAWAVNR